MSYIFDARFDNLKSQATYYIILKFKKLLLYKLNRRNFFNLKFFYLISQKIYHRTFLDYEILIRD